MSADTSFDPAVDPVAPDAFAGISLRRLAWRRLRRDKGAMIAMWALIIIFGTALLAPVIVAILGINPYDFDLTALDPAQGSLPAGSWGGASLAHPLGVEPLTGRDLLARLLFGARVSLFIACSAIFLIAIVGTFMGIVAGYKSVSSFIARVIAT